MSSRNKYTKEFKQQAVELAASLGNIKGAADRLGISDVLIHSWKKQFSGNDNLDTKEKKLSDIEKENISLKKELADLKKANHILKSAAAFFSQDHLK